MLNVTDWSECPCPALQEDKLSTGKGRQRLPHFDDVGGEQLPRLGTHIQRVVRRAGWYKEGVTGVQDEGGLPLDHHLHRPCENVRNFLTRMHVPARLAAGWYLDAHLHDLPSGNRGYAVLYITSAWTALSEEQRKKQPYAGDLFRLKTGMKGLEQPKFEEPHLR